MVTGQSLRSDTSPETSTWIINDRAVPWLWARGVLQGAAHSAPGAVHTWQRSVDPAEVHFVIPAGRIALTSIPGPFLSNPR